MAEFTPHPKPTTRAKNRRVAVAVAMREANAALLERSGGACEARTEVCTGRGEHRHHKLHRRHGDHSAENLLLVCRACHEWIHAHPTEAYERGWLVHAR